MASDPRFLEAWVNRRDHRVFGCRLQPLSLWHILALDAINSPFWGDESVEVTAADFLQAVAILSAVPPESLEIAPEAVKPGWLMALRAMPFSSKMPEANRRLKAYFSDYWSSVDVWPSEGKGGRLLQAPWLLARAVKLLRHTNLSERRIWTAPIGQVLCYAAAIEEQVGDTQIVTEQDREIMAELRKQEAENVGR